MSKAAEAQIAELAAPLLEKTGYELVRVRETGSGKYAGMQLMAERRDGAGMTVEDCVAISHMVSEKIEADPALAEKFALEVSSPGIDRPLVKLADYERFAGHVAKVDLAAPVAGKKRFTGKIARVSGQEIEFGTEGGALAVPFDAIAQAQLVLTDALMKAALRGEVKA